MYKHHKIFFLRGLNNHLLSSIKEIPERNVHILGGHIIGHSKQKNCTCNCAPFQTVSEIELFHCTVTKLLLNRYCVLFLISVFIVQVTKVVQFTQYNTLSKIPPSTTIHFASRVTSWRVARLSAS